MSSEKKVRKRSREEEKGVTSESLALVDSEMQEPFGGIADPFDATSIFEFISPTAKKRRVEEKKDAAPSSSPPQDQFEPMLPFAEDEPAADAPPIALPRPPLPFRPRIDADAIVPLMHDPFELPPAPRRAGPHLLAPDPALAAAIAAAGGDADAPILADVGAPPAAAAADVSPPPAYYVGPLPPPLRPTMEKYRVLRTGQFVNKDQFDALNEILDIYNAFNEFVFVVVVVVVVVVVIVVSLSLLLSFLLTIFFFSHFFLFHRSLSAAKSVLTKLMKKPFFQRAFNALRPQLTPLGIKKISDFRCACVFHLSPTRCVYVYSFRSPGLWRQ
jgi:hypothetical protein